MSDIQTRTRREFVVRCMKSGCDLERHFIYRKNAVAGAKAHIKLWAPEEDHQVSITERTVVTWKG